MTFKKGDLVMVVKPSVCCGGTADIGRVYMVSGVENGEEWTCSGCGYEYEEQVLHALENEDSAYDTRCLIKLDHPGVEDCLWADKELECS